MTSTVGMLVGGAFTGVTAIGGASQTIGQAAAPMLANSNPLEALKSQIGPAGSSPEALATTERRDDVSGDRKAGKRGNGTFESGSSSRYVKGIPLDQATEQVAALKGQYTAAVEEAKQQAIAAAQTTASVVSGGAILAFVALVLGVIADGWVAVLA